MICPRRTAVVLATVFVALVPVLRAEAQTVPTEASSSAANTGWKGFHSYFDGRFTQDYSVVGIAHFFTPTMNDGNPQNQIKTINQGEHVLEFRPDFSFKEPDYNLSLSIGPRLGISNTLLSTNSVESQQTQTYIFVNRYRARVSNVGPVGLTLTGTRDDIQWGPAIYASPSNTMSPRQPQLNPIDETRGRDYVTATIPLGQSFAITGMWNYGPGAVNFRPPPPSFPSPYATYPQTALGKIDGYFEDWSGSVIGGSNDVYGAFAGAYAQWTVNQSTLLYFDGVVHNKTPGLYPMSSSALPTGGSYGPLPGEQRWWPEFIVGGAWTSDSNFTFRLEYYYYGPGYDQQQVQLAKQFNAAAFQFQNTIPALSAGVLGLAASTNLIVPNQNTFIFEIEKTTSAAKFVVQNVFYVEDGSASTYGSAVFDFDRFTLSATGLVGIGPATSLARRDISAGASIGLKVKF